MHYLVIKAACDKLFAFTLLLLVAPLCVFVCLILLFDRTGPIFFTQLRPGLDGKPFRLIKFRTMTCSIDHSGVLLPDEKRITRLGSFLRQTSIDELPQLINILRGDMSFVGPRPLLMSYLPRYTPMQHRRHTVKPGLTGLAQTRGRNSLSWPKKIALDVWYAQNLSPLIDLSILLRTVVLVIQRHDVSASNPASLMPPPSQDDKSSYFGS